MKKYSPLAVAALTGLLAASMAGCSEATADSGGEADADPRACVILPDAASSPRFENLDRPFLQEGLEAAGFVADIQNAQGDTDKYATIADQQLTLGCSVMILVDLNGAAVAVAAKAEAEGIPVIAYERPFDGADYYVSFDNVEVGRLQGEIVLSGLEAAGVSPEEAVVVYIGGDPADGLAAQFREGANEVLSEAGITPAAEPAGAWDQAVSQTNFEQALTSLNGAVDGVWVANDTNAAGVIQVLQNNNLTGVAVSGQDANVGALQNILLGWQTGTVWRSVKEVSDAAIGIAVSLRDGTEIVADAELEDGTPYIQVRAVKIGPEQVADVIAAGGYATFDDVCTPEVAAACEEFGVVAP